MEQRHDPTVEPERGDSRAVAGAALLGLVEIIYRLRRQCPWDAKQTHESLAPYLLEETYEALEALEHEDPAELCGELGDVLLQVILHARIASERADETGFTIDDVANRIADKLVRRHPHVFGDVTVSGPDEVRQNWAAIKARERQAAGGGPGSALDGIPMGQPALSLAAQLQRRARAAGVPEDLADLTDLTGRADPTDLTGRADLTDLTGRADPAGRAGQPLSPVGAELFALVGRARSAGLDPELELRQAARAYAGRVRAWERSRQA